MKTPSATKKTKERIGTNVGETLVKLNCPKTVIVKASRLSIDTGVKYPDPDQIKSRTESPHRFEPMASSSDVPKHSNVQEFDFDEKRRRPKSNDRRRRPKSTEVEDRSSAKWPQTGSNISKPPTLFEIPTMNNPAAWISSKTQKDTKPIKN